jgi:hypothetical protein
MPIDWTMIGIGCGGGAIPDIIRFAKGRYKEELPAHYKSLNFWIGFAFLVALGGLAAGLGGATDPKAALAYGFGAPEIISRLLSSGPVVMSGPQKIISRWWSF